MRRSRIAVGSAFFLHGLCFASWGARIPAIQQRLNLSEAQLGSVLFALPVGSILSMPLAAWLVAKFGSRLVLSLALLLYALMLTTLGLAQVPIQLVGLLFFFGMASNLVNVSVNTQAIQVEALYGKSVMASLHGLWSLAGFVAAAIGMMMMAGHITPFWHFVLILLLSLLGVIFNFRYLVKDAASPSVENKGLVWPSRVLWCLGFIACGSMICEGMMFDWSGIYFKKVLLAQGAWISLGYTAFMSTMAGTRFFADGFVSRFGLRRVLQVSGLLTTTGLLTAVLMPSLPMATFGFLLVGMGVSAVVPLVFSAAGKLPTVMASVAVSTVSTIGFLGFLVGPPLIGWIAGLTSLRISFALISLMGLLTAYLAAKVTATSSRY
jgi:MFS family permease